MTMNITSIVGIILIIAVLSLMIKRYLPEYSMLINIASGIIVLSLILTQFLPIINQINQLLDSSKIPSEYRIILFKCIGICLIAQFASDACRDAGENSLASKVELAGKVSIVTIALPLFDKIIQTAIKLMGG